MSQKNNKKQRKFSGYNDPRNNFIAPKPLNFIQEQYISAINRDTIIFGVGSAGTGKTFLSANYAAEQLYNRNIDRIIITRPNVETGRSLGALPGDLEEKYAPYLEPFEEAFIDSLGRGFYDYALKSGLIVPKPLGFMRGATFKKSTIVLADEMQNATKAEMKMLLSRIGDNCTMIVSGDPEQADIRDSGLQDAVDRLEGIRYISVVRFLDSDIVRSAICKSIILAYRKNKIAN